MGSIKDRPRIIRDSRKIPRGINFPFSAIERLAREAREEDEEQLEFNFGPVAELALMILSSDGYAKDLSERYLNKYINRSDLFVAKPKTGNVEKDDDGDYDMDELEISQFISLNDIWELSRQFPDLTLMEYLKLNFMQNQMGLLDKERK